MDPGEQPAETVVREVYEETAVHVVPERVTSVLTQPAVTYPNGDRCEYVDITFRCRAIGGEARVNDDESLAVAWFALDDLPPVADLIRHRIECALAPITVVCRAGRRQSYVSDRIRTWSSCHSSPTLKRFVPRTVNPLFS